jgi:hypothetical protein
MHLRREWERREEREVGSSEPLEARPATGGELWQWGAEDAKERGDEGAVVSGTALGVPLNNGESSLNPGIKAR